jgi:hypothetical protein
MDPSQFTLVRFTVAEGTLHTLLSGNPGRRRALRDVTWGSRDTNDGQVLVTPPLGVEPAAQLRSVLAGAEGVTEVDVSAEYTVGYTTAPVDYDGFGTLSLGVEASERVVAIRTEHLNWQASRYASGLHRFRPAAPPPNAEPAPAPETGTTAEAPAGPPRLDLDTVVHLRGRTRRYVIVRVETIGETRVFSMVALSGAAKGCYPSAVPADELERDADQTVAFKGAAAAALQRKYEAACSTPSSAAVPMAS